MIKLQAVKLIMNPACHLLQTACQRLMKKRNKKRSKLNKGIVTGISKFVIHVKIVSLCLNFSGKDRNLNIVELLCANCVRWFHESCIGYQLGKLVPFLFNYVFHCKNCSPTGLEMFRKSQAREFFDSSDYLTLFSIIVLKSGQHFSFIIFVNMLDTLYRNIFMQKSLRCV